MQAGVSGIIIQNIWGAFDPDRDQRAVSVLMAQPSSTINFTGHQYFRSRLVLSILSGKHVRITKIRSEDKNPGLRGAVS